MTRQDVVLTADEFDAIDMLAARFAMSPAEFVRRITSNAAGIASALAIHGREALRQ